MCIACCCCCACESCPTWSTLWLTEISILIRSCATCCLCCKLDWRTLFDACCTDCWSIFKSCSCTYLNCEILCACLTLWVCNLNCILIADCTSWLMGEACCCCCACESCPAWGTLWLAEISILIRSFTTCCLCCHCYRATLLYRCSTNCRIICKRKFWVCTTLCCISLSCSSCCTLWISNNTLNCVLTTCEIPSVAILRGACLYCFTINDKLIFIACFWTTVADALKCKSCASLLRSWTVSTEVNLKWEALWRWWWCDWTLTNICKRSCDNINIVLLSRCTWVSCIVACCIIEHRYIERNAIESRLTTSC